jgi:hypothetical protein
MALEDGGRVSMQLNCNRASGSWSATAVDVESGTFRFGPLAATRALCPPPSLDERIARDADFVRSYLRRDGRLYLNLMAASIVRAASTGGRLPRTNGPT